MQIIIAGLGKAGMCLVGALAQEGHDITVVDTKPDQVQRATAQYDVMGISGNCADPDTLTELEVDQADMFIAVTTNDEVNLLSCLLAKRAGCSKTIARVRNPEHSSSMDYLQNALGLEMIINPELLAAEEIERVLSLPGAIDVDAFSAGRGEILKFRIIPGSVLDGMQVKQISRSVHADIMVCIAERGSQTFIPDGEFRFKGGDFVYIAGTRSEAERFFASAGLRLNTVKNVMAIGAGKLSYYLIELLQKAGMQVTLIDQNMEACEKMTLMYPGAIVLQGDATNQQFLLDEGLEEMDAFISMTGVDEENIFLSLYAKRKADLKTVTKVTHIELDEMFTDFELDTLINPKTLSAEYIIRHVRALANSRGSQVKTVHKLAHDRVEALEFEIGPNSPVTGIKLMDLPIKSGVLVALIERDGRLFLPRGIDIMREGDSVVIVTDRPGFTDVSDILETRRR